MTILAQNLQVLRMAARMSLLDFFAMFTVKTYLIAWAPRIVAQVAFYVLFAGFAGGPDFVKFALIGNAVQLMNQTATGWVTASVTWEQRLGTLPLLISSPSSPLLVLSGRNFGMGVHGYLTGLLGVLLVAPLLGLQITVLQGALVALLLLLITFSCYGFGLFLGGMALQNRAYRSVIANTVTMIMLSIAGVNFPVSSLPAWIQPISYSLPMTHGLMAIRGVLDGATPAYIWQQVGLEALIGSIFLLLALLVFNRLLNRGRKLGTLELY